MYPNKEQRIFLAKTFGCTRAIWNKMLADKIRHYEETGKLLKNTPAGYKEEFPWLKEVDSLALANAQVNLQRAYKSFFDKPDVGFPKFKKKSHAQSYTTNSQNGTIDLVDGKIKLPKIGWIKVKQQRKGQFLHSNFDTTIIEKPFSTSKIFLDISHGEVAFNFPVRAFSNNLLILGISGLSMSEYITKDSLLVGINMGKDVSIASSPIHLMTKVMSVLG